MLFWIWIFEYSHFRLPSFDHCFASKLYKCKMRIKHKYISDSLQALIACRLYKSLAKEAAEDYLEVEICEELKNHAE